MLCSKCGKELLDGAKFCDKCGTPVNIGQDSPETGLPDQNGPESKFSDHSSNDLSDQTPAELPVQTPTKLPDQTPGIRPPEIYSDYPREAPVAPEQPKPRKKNVFVKIIALFLIAIVFMSALTVLGYFTFLPAKYTLWTAEYFSVQKAYNELDNSWTRLENKTDPIYKESVKSNTEVNFSIDTNVLTGLGIDQQTADMIKEYLTGMTLKFGAEADISNKKGNLSVGLSYQNNPVVSLNAFISDKNIGLSIPELSKKSLVGEFKDLPRLSELYPESIYPGQLDYLATMDPWMANTLRDEITIKHEDIKKLMQTYAMAFVNSLDSSDMSIKRGQTTDLFGEETKCQELTVTLDQKAQKALISSLLDTVKEDDNFYNLVFGNLTKLYNIMSKSNPAMTDSLQGVDVETIFKRPSVNMIISEIKKSITEDILPEKMTIKVYIKGLDVVKYEIEIPANDSVEPISLVIERLINGDSTSNRITLSANTGTQKVTVYIDIKKQYDKASDTQDTAIELSMDLSGAVNGNATIKFDNKQEPDGKNKVKQTTDITLSGYFQDTGNTNLSVRSQGTITRNSEGLQTGYDGTVDVSVDVPGALPQPVSLALAIKNTTEYGKKVETPAWATGDTVNIATATREDMDAYFQELNNALGMLSLVFGGM